MAVLLASAVWIVVGLAVALLFGRAARRQHEPVAPDHGLGARPRIGPRIRPPLSDEAAVAVHGLIASSDVVVGGLETLRASWSELSPPQREALLDVVLGQALAGRDLLGDLLEDTPAQLRRSLDDVAADQIAPADLVSDDHEAERRR